MKGLENSKTADDTPVISFDEYRINMNNQVERNNHFIYSRDNAVANKFKISRYNKEVFSLKAKGEILQPTDDRQDSYFDNRSK